MSFELNINANETAPRKSKSDPVPAGIYQSILTEVAWHTSQAGNQSLKLEFEIADGEFRGRKLWRYLGILNPDASKADYAKAEVAEIGRALGVSKIRVIEDLPTFKPFFIKVGLRKNQQSGELENQIKNYAATVAELNPQRPAATPPAQRSAPNPAAPAARTTTTAPPWQR